MDLHPLRGRGPLGPLGMGPSRVEGGSGWRGRLQTRSGKMGFLAYWSLLNWFIVKSNSFLCVFDFYVNFLNSLYNKHWMRITIISNDFIWIFSYTFQNP